MEVVAGTPVSASIILTSARSPSSPVHEPAVPFQAITSTWASANSRAASSITAVENWSSESGAREMCVTRIRVKCTVTASPSGVRMRVVSGSTAVLDEGVIIPMRLGRID